MIDWLIVLILVFVRLKPRDPRSVIERRQERLFLKGRVIEGGQITHRWTRRRGLWRHGLSVRSNGNGIRIRPTLWRKHRATVIGLAAMFAIDGLIWMFIQYPSFFFGIGAVNTWSAAADPGNWSLDANWSLGHKPAIGEDVVFDATSLSSCDIDENTAVLDSFLMNTNYTGTVDLDVNTLNVTTTADTSSFTGTQGTFTGGSGTINVSGNWDTSSASFTFTRETSTADLTGTGTITLRDYHANAFYHLNVGAPGKTTTAGGSAIGIYGVLTVGTGTHTGSETYLWGTGAGPHLVNNGTITAPISYNFNANTSVTSTTYGSSLATYANGGDYTATLLGNVSCTTLYLQGWGAGILSILDTAGFSITASSLSIGETATTRDGRLIANSSTIAVTGNVLIKNAGSYIEGNTSTWTVAIHWTNASTHASFDMGTSTVTFDGGVTQNITTNGDAFFDVATSGAGTIATQLDDLTCSSLNIGANSTWTKTGYALDCSNGTLTVTGTLTDINTGFTQSKAIKNANFSVTGTFNYQNSWLVNCGGTGSGVILDDDKVVLQGCNMTLTTLKESALQDPVTSVSTPM